MFRRASFTARLVIAAAVLVGCAAPPADEPATFRGLADRGDPGFLDGGSPSQWFDLVVFHRNATPTEAP